MIIRHDNLDEFRDAVDYDRRDSSNTGVAFYAALARESGGPVLELACGTGRVSIPIARLGITVTGLDLVPGMIARARHKLVGLPARWLVGDARTFDLGEHFRLIFLTGNAFQLFLTNADQAALLRRVRAHLAADGLFAFETRNPVWATEPDPTASTVLPAGAADDGGFFARLESRAEEPVGLPTTDAQERVVQHSRAQTYDHVAQILHVTSYQRWWTGDRQQTTARRIALRYTFPQEVAALLEHHGLPISQQYGDWTREPLTATSRSMIVVCHPAR